MSGAVWVADLNLARQLDEAEAEGLARLAYPTGARTEAELADLLDVLVRPMAPSALMLLAVRGPDWTIEREDEAEHAARLRRDHALRWQREAPTPANAAVRDADRLRGIRVERRW